MKNNKLLQFKWIRDVVLVLSFIQKQTKALKTINVEDCFASSMRNDTPSCTFQMSDEARHIAINCVRPGVLRIVGDYKAVYINCSAGYPLDFKFDGHKPTEAIETLSWAMVETNSGGKIISHHLEAKIFSIPSLHDHYVALFPETKIIHRDSYNYSRTGSYVFSGFNQQEHFQSKFYIFFEETSAVLDLLRNENVVVRLPNVKHKSEEHLLLVVPCRPSHFSANVTIQQNGSSIDFNYDPVVGFTSNESWKSVIENDPSLVNSEIEFTCFLNQNSDVMTFSTKELRKKYGHDGLPTTESSSILTNVDTLNNGSVIIHYLCEFEQKFDGFGSLAVQDVVNPSMYRLIQHFILPVKQNLEKFNARSYSTNFTKTTIRLGIGDQETIRKSSISNVLCADSTTFHTATIDVGPNGRHVSFPLGFEASRTSGIGYRSTGTYFKILHDQPNNALYENQLVVFRCYIASFTFIRPAIWYTERANGSVIEEVIDYDWKENYFSYAQIHLTPDVRKILVAASIFYTPSWRNFSTAIKFEKSIKSTFDDSQISIQKFRLNSNQILSCTVIGVPQPLIHWQRNGKNISSTVSFVNHTSVLEFLNVQQEDAGDYVCVATNVASVEKKIFNVQVFVETDLGLIIGLSVSIFICGALAIIAAWVYFKLLRIGKAALTKSEIDDFLNGERDENNLMEGNSDGKEYAHDVTHLRPYNTEFELEEKRFSINMSQVLGSGAFGMVVMGSLDGVPVAVKTAKRNADKPYLKALLSELKVMTFLGTHENIVGLLGASTINLCKGQVFLFVPFCALGSLQGYLMKNRRYFHKHPVEYVNTLAVSSPSISSEAVTSDQNMYENVTSHIKQDYILSGDKNCPESMTTKDLYQWATQIAQGMEYLSSKKVLHGDLAARNVLLTEARIAKISDFGLSRRLYDYSDYAKTQQEPLPWRWMSVESLRDLTFSTKSDVWSYGITLWEIFSLGQVPYPGYSWTMDFVKELESGIRMSCPPFASEKLYNAVMKECWHNDPELRPFFAQIQKNLSVLH